MATLKDIARHLGLSVTQVSRALNGHSDVSAATRERVAEAARALGYSANISARMLKSGRSGIVAMVVSAEAEQDLPDVLVASVIGLSAEFSRRRMQFVLHVTTEGEDEADAHRRLAGSGLIDGFILVTPVPGDPRIALLAERETPFVVHGRDRERPAYPFVDIDNRGLAHRLAAHLAGLGHRRIAFVDGPAGTAFAAARSAGFHDALRESGLAMEACAHLNVRMTEASGRAAAERLFAPGGPRPTGIVAGNTALATGLYAGLAALGLSVPGDVSVVAHDDGLARAPAESFAPPLTATRSPLAASWAPLAEALVAATEGGPAGPRQTVLSPDFLPGASAAAPADATRSAAR